MKKIFFIVAFSIISIFSFCQGGSTTPTLKQVANAGNISFKNLFYNGNYHSGISQFWLTDKKYVDSLNSITANNSWKILGNSGTNSTINFLGNVDSVDLIFRTNNQIREKILSSGNAIFYKRIGINTTPLQALDIAGKIKVDSLSAGTSADSIVVWNSVNHVFYKVQRNWVSKNFWRYGTNISGIDTGLICPVAYATKKVGIGMKSPDAVLHVQGFGTTSGTKSFQIDNSSFLNLMTVLDNGQTGINTTSPDNALTVYANSTNQVTLGTRVGTGYTSPTNVITITGSVGFRNPSDANTYGNIYGFYDGSGDPGINIDAYRWFNISSRVTGRYLLNMKSATANNSAYWAINSGNYGVDDDAAFKIHPASNNSSVTFDVVDTFDVNNVDANKIVIGGRIAYSGKNTNTNVGIKCYAKNSTSENVGLWVSSGDVRLDSIKPFANNAAAAAVLGTNHKVYYTDVAGEYILKITHFWEEEYFDQEYFNIPSKKQDEY